MKKETVDLIMTQLDKIAAKIGITVEQIRPWLLNLRNDEVLWGSLLFLSFSIVVVMVCYLLFSLNKKEKEIIIKKTWKTWKEAH